MYAILLMNAATPLIDRVTQPRVFGRRAGMSRDRPALNAETRCAWCLTLALAGLLSGLCHRRASTQVTQPMIDAQPRRGPATAPCFEVVPGAERLQRLAWRDGAARAGAGRRPPKRARSVYAAYDDGGRARSATPSPARAPASRTPSSCSTASTPRASGVVGMQVLESRETPGLGDKIFKDQDFVGNFRDLARRARDRAGQGRRAAADNEVDAHHRRDDLVEGGGARSSTQSNADWLAAARRRARSRRRRAAEMARTARDER